jgi:hypothetical protein
MRHRHDGDHAIENFRDVADDVDAATPVDAQNAPTGVWKSRKEREIPTASTSIIFFSDEEEEQRTKPRRSTVHRIGSPPRRHRPWLREGRHIECRQKNGSFNKIEDVRPVGASASTLAPFRTNQHQLTIDS